MKKSETDELREELQDTMSFLGAIASGMETFLGRPANGMSFLAGKKLGKQFTENEKKTTDILEAIERSMAILKKNHFLWVIEPWKKKDEEDFISLNEDGNKTIKLVFRDCMIRQTLFKYGHAQKASLCYMMYGFFSGLTESLLGMKSELRILHTGQNACLKELTLIGAK